ncbi:MAG: hypothetical protein M3R04_07280 [bacterium]|nr:hypothetical protein [bacterium]
MVDPTRTTRERIIEANKYRPVNAARAHRGYVKNWVGRFQPTIKKRGDLVINDLGPCIEM